MVPVGTTRPAITAAQPPALLTTAQRAQREGVTPKCIRERIKAGRLPGWKIGDRWLTEEPRP
jgi:hypothetical protein